MPALVSALKSVDLPTFGSPTIPQRTVIWLSRRPLRMERHHCAFHVAAPDVRPHDERAIDRIDDCVTLFRPGRLQHVIDDVLLRQRRIARMADAETQAPEIRL